MSVRRRTVGAVAMTTSALAILLAFHLAPTERLLAAYVLALAAIALIHLIRAFRGGLAPARLSRFEHALHERAKPVSRPGVFLAMDREIELGVAHAGRAHRRLLPLLRAAAAARLQASHGVELERGTAAARRLLGDEAWELLRPDRPAPTDPFGPGPPRETIAAVIGRVEQL
jgi:hypothetical protein